LASPLLPKGEASAKGEEKPFGFAQGKKFGSWEPGLLPLEGMLDQKNYGVIDGYSR